MTGALGAVTGRPGSTSARVQGVVVVTGAGMGIGAATAELLVERGATVVGVDWNEDALRETAHRLGPSLVPLIGDIDWNTHERAADAAQAAGELVGWVNNACVDRVGYAHTVTAAEIEEGVRLLQLGPTFGTCVPVRRMLPRRSRTIVNVASIQGVVAFPRSFVYQAAKAAVIMMSRGVAVDYGPLGLRCNAVLPGSVRTPMMINLLDPSLPLETALEEEGALAPMGRIADSQEIAEVILPPVRCLVAHDRIGRRGRRRSDRRVLRERRHRRVGKAVR
jgi:NAD(P)-dependent dehydrogenase (short-subunit alcohol dehydrogenase family)